MKRVIKTGLVVLLGAAIWTNGGDVKDVRAQENQYQIWQNQRDEQQRQQQQQADRQAQEDAMRRNPAYACVTGRDIYGYIGDAACGGGEQPNNPKPVVKKPSSYGAVAWDTNKVLLGISTGQANKQAAINAAMRKCGQSSCQIATTYWNQCVAISAGVKNGNKYWWQSSTGLSQSQAEGQSISDCSKNAKGCQILVSECSLAGDIATNQTTQYKGLGE